MNVSQYLMNGNGSWKCLDDIRCHDGFTISVQASRTHYCTPRSDTGPWTEVECGFPSEACPELMEYTEEKDNPTGTVYAYVPIGKVQELIDRHNGLEPATPTPAPKGTPGRSAADILDSYARNLEMALDCASIKLGRLKDGSSAHKVQRGVVRGFQEALQALRTESGL